MIMDWLDANEFAAESESFIMWSKAVAPLAIRLFRCHELSNYD